MSTNAIVAVKDINQDELISLVGRTLDQNDDLDEIGYTLALDASESNGLGMRNVWEQVKLEFRALVCTEDPRYSTVRQQARKFSQKNTTAFVSLISAGLGAAIGISAVALLPLVGLLLMAVVKMGTETFCHLQK
jgi:hypothetical protein